MNGRSIPEWVGATPDTKVPPRVRLRVFERHGGRCHLSGILINGKPWELEHVKPLHAGGEHRESNLAPALVDAHKRKSAAERTEKAKVDATAKKHVGARLSPARPIRSAPFPASGRRHKHPMPSLPPRPLYVERRDV